MKNIILGLILTVASINASALTEIDFNSCSDSIKNEVLEASQTVADLEDTTKASEDLVNALSFSITGTIVSSPDCNSLKGLAKRYTKIATELKKLK